MRITLSVRSNGDEGRRRLVEAAVEDVRALATDAAESGRPNVPHRTGRLARSVAVEPERDGATITAGGGHPGMRNPPVRGRTVSALWKSTRAALREL